MSKIQVKVANVHFANTTFKSEQAFWSEINRRLEELQHEQVRLVLFPGLTGGLHARAARLNLNSPSEFHKQVSQTRPAFYDEISKLARVYRLYLVPGTTFIELEGRFYHAAPLFAPDGRLLGEQLQTHLSRSEREKQLGRGIELNVWPTPYGRLGICTGTDIWYPEVSRILALQGADIVLAPAAVSAPYNPWLQLAGMWQETQQNQFFALENWLNGQLGNTLFAGRSPILAPCEMTPGETGYLQTRAANQSCLAVLDLEKRRQVTTAYPLFNHLNRSLYRRYLPGLYERRETGGLV